jgi:pheromone shutdown protein TraB
MIHIIGTSHIAKESLELVEKVIKKEKPGFVCIELDKDRYDILKGNKKEVKLKDLPFLNRIFYWLLKNIQKNISSYTGIMSGQEMLNAIKYGKEVGSKVALIDQKIHITFNNINKAMLFKERIRLFSYLILSSIALTFPFIPLNFMINKKTKEKVKKIDLNKIPDDELIEYSMEYLLKKFPTLYFHLVHERNKYMASNLMKINEQAQNIVAVIGAGHVKGIKEILQKQLYDVKTYTSADLDIDIYEPKDLEQSQESKLMNNIKELNKTESQLKNKEKKEIIKKHTEPKKQENKSNKNNPKEKQKFNPKDYGINIDLN